MKKKEKLHNLLFITWDGPQTSYMEGLFMPIFNALAKKQAIKFHIIQFTWAGNEKIAQIKQLAERLDIYYSNYEIIRKPHPLIGAVVSVWKGKRYLQQYIKDHDIDIVMPRSTFPAIMVNGIKLGNAKLIFDADGLPLEERVDFSGLSKKSLQYKRLKKQETIMLKKADGVITRSAKAIDIHIDRIGQAHKNKFAVVFNGRDEDVFKPDESLRARKRKELQILENETAFIYCGSLGAQYGWEDMLDIFETYAKNNPAKWVIITGNQAYAIDRIPFHLKEKVIVISLPFAQVHEYLNIADVAFAIRQPSFSMQGVAPIKIGEYMLTGIPTIASQGIGDTGEILKYIQGGFIYNHPANTIQTQALMTWLDSVNSIDRAQIREQALSYFSIETSADSYASALNKFVF